MRRLLSLEPDCDLVAECANGQEAVDALRQHPVDVMFLDIQMPGMSGFEVVAAIAELRPLVIFTSAYDEYAVKAFDVHAFDYLLKPFDGRRFRDSLHRAKARIEMERGGVKRDRELHEMFANFSRAQQKAPDRVAVRNNGRVVFVKVDEIDWVEASDNYVCLHVGRDTHVIRETMNQLEQRLSGTQFLRVHRSAIVNLDRIRELQPWFRGDYRVILRDGTELTLTKNHREKLESRLLLGAGAR
jgi:two-component system LytT family response regulator